MIPFLQYDQPFATTDHQKILRCVVQMMSVRMVQNAAMISAIARTVKSIANFQRALDIGMADPTVRVQEEAVQEALQEVV